MIHPMGMIFHEEQGYDMEPSLLNQDNMSAILLETNRNWEGEQFKEDKAYQSKGF